MRPILLNARAAARPELGGVERWAREVIARLPALGLRTMIPPQRAADAAAALGAVSYGVWEVLDNALGRGLFGQIVSLTTGLGLGLIVYLGVAKLLRIAELEQMVRLIRRR